MARQPSELNHKPVDRTKRRVDKLESLIDTMMDEFWRGGVINFDTTARGVVVDQALLDELRQRYHEWQVDYKTGMFLDGSGWAYLQFTPKG